MPNYEVGEIGFSKFHSDTAFSKQGYFCHSVFVNRSILPIFRILKAPVPSECGNEVPFSQKSCFIIKNVHNWTLLYPIIMGNFLFHSIVHIYTC